MIFDIVGAVQQSKRRGEAPDIPEKLREDLEGLAQQAVAQARQEVLEEEQNKIRLPKWAKDMGFRLICKHKDEPESLADGSDDYERFNRSPR